MIYLQPRRHARTLQSRTFAIGIVVVVILLGFASFFSSAVQGAIHSFFSPLWAVERGIFGESGFLRSLVSDKQALLDENVNLRLSLVEARQNGGLVSELFRQNTELKEMLGRDALKHKMVAAVIARPPQLLYDTLILDIGRDGGVEVGDGVYVLGNVVIGSIQEVLPRTSIVELYSTAGIETDVFVGGIATVAKGRGGGNYVIELPRDIPMATGTPVLLPGIEVSIFGTVESVVAHPADPAQLLYFRNPFSMATLHFVSIGAKNVSVFSEIEEEESFVEAP